MILQLSRPRADLAWRGRGVAWLSAALLMSCLPLLAGCGEDTAVESEKADVSAGADAPSGDIATDAGNATQAGVTATSAGATSGARVTLEADVEADDSITVSVLVRDYDELYAIASHLTWDPKALQLLEHKGHLLLAGSGYSTRSLVKPTEGGVLLLGAARFKDGGSPWSPIQAAKVGNEIWATLRFKLLGEKAELKFDPAHSLAKNASYEAVSTGWQRLTIARTGKGGGQ